MNENNVLCAQQLNNGVFNMIFGATICDCYVTVFD